MNVADKLELGGIELRLAFAVKGNEIDQRRHHSQIQSVLGRCVVKLVGQLHAAATGNVLDDHVRISRNVLSEMLGEYTCGGIEPATGAKPHLNEKLFSLVEISDGIRLCCMRQDTDPQRDGRGQTN